MTTLGIAETTPTPRKPWPRGKSLNASIQLLGVCSCRKGRWNPVPKTAVLISEEAHEFLTLMRKENKIEKWYSGLCYCVFHYIHDPWNRSESRDMYVMTIFFNNNNALDTAPVDCSRVTFGAVPSPVHAPPLSTQGCIGRCYLGCHLSKWLTRSIMVHWCLHLVKSKFRQYNRLLQMDRWPLAIICCPLLLVPFFSAKFKDFCAWMLIALFA